MLPWLRAIARETAPAVLALLSGLSTLATFFIPKLAGYPRGVLAACFVAGFGWANLRIYDKQQKQIRATRISVDFRDGWYALYAHNVADPTTRSAHFRLRLTAANRDDRNTTLSFLTLRVPGHTALAIKQAKLYPEGMVPPTLMTAVDINAGRTLPTIVEAHLTFPSNDPTPWGPTVGVQIDFGETFTHGPITLSAEVPTTP